MEGKVLVKNPNGASNAWKYFGFWKIGTKVCKDFAVCFECKQECKYSGSTSNLNEHLKRHHTETMPLHQFLVKEYSANLANYSTKEEPLLRARM